jgi:hypothetical protein
MRRIAIESWDPDYGAPVDGAVLEPTDVNIDPDVEMVASNWRPVTLPAGEPASGDVVFIDGVRRTDAFAWITQDDRPPFRALLASFAAGAVRAASKAQLVSVKFRRVLVASERTDAIETKAGTWQPRIASGNTPEQLSLTVQECMTELEIDVASGSDAGAELVVIDGPLRGRQNIAGAVGYVKTHQVAYLPAPLQPVVAALKAGERTPVFRCTTSWSRFSWYMRLPGPASHAWCGIVRLEASERLPASSAIDVANRTAVVLPKFASAVHKDPRAPQNLFPIGGLERELRRRLGDRQIIERALRVELV